MASQYEITKELGNRFNNQLKSYLDTYQNVLLKPYTANVFAPITFNVNIMIMFGNIIKKIGEEITGLYDDFIPKNIDNIIEAANIDECEYIEYIITIYKFHLNNGLCKSYDEIKDLCCYKNIVEKIKESFKNQIDNMFSINIFACAIFNLYVWTIRLISIKSFRKLDKLKKISITFPALMELYDIEINIIAHASKNLNLINLHSEVYTNTIDIINSKPKRKTKATKV